MQRRAGYILAKTLSYDGFLLFECENGKMWPPLIPKTAAVERWCTGGRGGEESTGQLNIRTSVTLKLCIGPTPCRYMSIYMYIYTPYVYMYNKRTNDEWENLRLNIQNEP